MKINQIICGDALRETKKLPDKSIDLILTDPPYNAEKIGPNKRTYSQGKMKLSLKEYKKFCRDWFKEAKRIGKRIVFTPGIANTHFYPQPYWQICWHKPAARSFNRMGGFNAWEPIFIYGKLPKGKRIGQDYMMFITHNFDQGPEKDHPCPKPLALWEWLIDKFSNEGDLVLDPFIGSGTTALACKRLKRNYIGIELNPKYCEMAGERIKAQPEPLF